MSLTGAGQPNTAPVSRTRAASQPSTASGDRHRRKVQRAAVKCPPGSNFLVLLPSARSPDQRVDGTDGERRISGRSVRVGIEIADRFKQLSVGHVRRPSSTWPLIIGVPILKSGLL